MTRVLMVDDDQRLRTVVRSVLEDDGIEIVGDLADGREAVRLTEQLEPDVILIETTLASMPGLAVADAIRRLRPDQPIVLQSCMFDPRLERIAVAHRLVYLAKCEGLDALEHAIERAMLPLRDRISA